MTTRRRARGFTLVELMVVVALISVIASIAIFTMSKSRLETEVDDWINQFVQNVAQARKRAVTTRSVYMLHVKASTLQWCAVDPATVTGTVTTQTACPPATATVERGILQRAKPGAIFVKYATAIDAQNEAATYSTPTRTDFNATSLLLFFGPNGTAADTYAKAVTTGAVVTGFSVYAEPTRGQSNYKIQKRRRAIVLGATAHTRVITGW